MPSWPERLSLGLMNTVEVALRSDERTPLSNVHDDMCGLTCRYGEGHGLAKACLRTGCCLSRIIRRSLGTSEPLNANKGSTIATKTLEFVNQVELFARVSS